MTTQQEPREINVYWTHAPVPNLSFTHFFSERAHHSLFNPREESGICECAKECRMDPPGAKYERLHALYSALSAKTNKSFIPHANLFAVVLN